MSLVNQVPSEVDLVTAHLMLAEDDRILSLTPVVLMAHTHSTLISYTMLSVLFRGGKRKRKNAQLQQSRRSDEWNGYRIRFFPLSPSYELLRSESSVRIACPCLFFSWAAQLIMYCYRGLFPPGLRSVDHPDCMTVLNILVRRRMRRRNTGGIGSWDSNHRTLYALCSLSCMQQIRRRERKGSRVWAVSFTHGDQYARGNYAHRCPGAEFPRRMQG